jgi:transcriptional regulator with XRE-family HTH domain
MWMIDAAQVRAARGLLGWSQKYLGEMAGGLHGNAISKIERGEVTAPHQDTLEKIIKALEVGGVEFLPRSGVQKRDIVEIYEGEDSEDRLSKDIYKTLIHTTHSSSDHRELLIAHLKEDESRKYLGTPDIEKLIRERKEAGITQRLLVRAHDPDLFPPSDSYTYHSMPDQYFSEHSLYIYGSKLAIVARNSKKSVIINDERFADCARKLFNFIWDHTDEVKFDELEKEK